MNRVRTEIFSFDFILKMQFKVPELLTQNSKTCASSDSAYANGLASSSLFEGLIEELHYFATNVMPIIQLLYATAFIPSVKRVSTRNGNICKLTDDSSKTLHTPDDLFDVDIEDVIYEDVGLHLV